MESLRRFSIAGRMKPSREPRPRLGEKRGRGGNGEGSPHRSTGADPGAEIAGDRDPKKRRGGVNCGEVHSKAREMVTRGYIATLVAAALAISRSSLYYRSGREETASGKQATTEADTRAERSGSSRRPASTAAQSREPIMPRRACAGNDADSCRGAVIGNDVNRGGALAAA
jgi:hypothetical protein